MIEFWGVKSVDDSVGAQVNVPLQTFEGSEGHKTITLV